MFTFGYTSRKSRILKAAVVLGIGLLLIATRIGFWIIIGGALVFVGARDLLYIAQEKKPQPQKDQRQASSGPAEEGKITITDLSDAKEVDFTKE